MSQNVHDTIPEDEFREQWERKAQDLGVDHQECPVCGNPFEGVAPITSFTTGGEESDTPVCMTAVTPLHPQIATIVFHTDDQMEESESESTSEMVDIEVE